ncbi:uncharacterized protein EV420DRAFT_1621006 [Desarmillaria tabescens]|uniref:NAD(P)-binding protein n=1 Tax=Armillaria tabescens TaxID=1929756 RepID=A0AA39KB07_ARMTA|nr:uncharacterized protein EV420DRAFT_1621006 [Desarmillaria tabescens]KAK0457852.1 hypothetical protein EV420DRAFT_1621006 [Desarmillaria tabescens]
MAPSSTFTTSLSGKVALVTGSSRGIGAAIAKRLADEGASVVINYVNSAKPAQELVSEIKSKGKGNAAAIKADASTIAGGKHLLDETIKAFGKLDILVLNAGIMGSKPLADIDETFFDNHINANVKGPLFLAKAASQVLPSPGGRIIFFSSSLTAASAVLPNALCYVISKGAVEQASRVLAKDLGARGMTVNTISPGPVDTDLFRAGKPQKVIDMIASQNPSNKLGQPEENCSCCFWVNGQNIRVNGTIWLNHTKDDRRLYKADKAVNTENYQVQYVIFDGL